MFFLPNVEQLCLTLIYVERDRKMREYKEILQREVQKMRKDEFDRLNEINKLMKDKP